MEDFEALERNVHNLVKGSVRIHSAENEGISLLRKRSQPLILLRKKKKKNSSSIVDFYSHVLSWKMKNGLSRADLGLPRLTKAPVVYNNPAEYFRMAVEVAVEECRAFIEQSLQLRSPSSEILRLQYVEHSLHGELVALEMILLSGDREVLRPGAIFKLRPLPSSLSSEGRSCLATVAQGTYAHEVTARKNILLWLHAHQFIDGDEGEGFWGTSTWQACCLGSAITSQRIFSQACSQVEPPFIYKLLGHKQSTHLKFSIDSDESSPILAPIDALQYSFHSEEPCIYHCDHGFGDLNKSQQKAYAKCIDLTGEKGRIQLIQGPPGCGKSHFLSVLLEGLVARKKKVMVCCPSNKSLLVLLELFLERRQVQESNLSVILVGVDAKLNLDVSKNKGSSLTDKARHFLEPIASEDVFFYTAQKRTMALLETMLHSLTASSSKNSLELEVQILFQRLMNKLQKDCPCLYNKKLKKYYMRLQEEEGKSNEGLSILVSKVLEVLAHEDMQAELVASAGNVFAMHFKVI